MLQLDILSLIPKSVKKQVRDTVVDFVADQAKDFLSDEVSAKIKKLRSDAAFQATFDKAFTYHSEALKKSEETGDTEQIAFSLWRMSDILWQKGRFEEARPRIKEALRICEQFNIVNGVANCCLLLARIERSSGKIDEARKYAERAPRINSRLRSEHHLKETEEALELLNRPA